MCVFLTANVVAVVVVVVVAVAVYCCCFCCCCCYCIRSMMCWSSTFDVICLLCVLNSLYMFFLRSLISSVSTSSRARSFVATFIVVIALCVRVIALCRTNIRVQKFISRISIYAETNGNKFCCY